MKSVLLFDLETTGTDPDADHAIEVGCILYSLEYATPVEFFASLLEGEHNEAQAINRIPPEALQHLGRNATEVWTIVRELASVADVIVAHRAAFDLQFVPEDLRTFRPWVCSANDIAWPQKRSSWDALSSLALAHDVGVVEAHRALADCSLLARLLTRCSMQGVNLSALLVKAARPKATFQALVSYDQRELAKSADFHWEPATKRWLRTMAVDDAARLPFQTKEIQ